MNAFVRSISANLRGKAGPFAAPSSSAMASATNNNNNTISIIGNNSVIAMTVRHMSKNMSKSATKRAPLTTKRAGKGYKKGKGETKEGHVNSKGRFIVDGRKRLKLVVPDLEGFQLKPYIAHSVSKFAPEIRR